MYYVLTVHVHGSHFKSEIEIYGIPRVLERDKKFHGTVQRVNSYNFNSEAVKHLFRKRLACIASKMSCVSVLF